MIPCYLISQECQPETGTNVHMENMGHKEMVLSLDPRKLFLGDVPDIIAKAMSERISKDKSLNTSHQLFQDCFYDLFPDILLRHLKLYWNDEVVRDTYKRSIAQNIIDMTSPTLLSICFQLTHDRLLENHKIKMNY